MKKYYYFGFFYFSRAENFGKIENLQFSITWSRNTRTLTQKKFETLTVNRLPCASTSLIAKCQSEQACDTNIVGKQ